MTQAQFTAMIAHYAASKWAECKVDEHVGETVATAINEEAHKQFCFFVTDHHGPLRLHLTAPLPFPPVKINTQPLATTFDDLPDLERAIMGLLTDRPVSVKVLMKKTDYKNYPYFAGGIRRLKAKGLLIRVNGGVRLATRK